MRSVLVVNVTPLELFTLRIDYLDNPPDETSISAETNLELG